MPDGADVPDDPRDALDDILNRVDITNALRTLKRQDQAVVLLYYGDGRTVREIADHMSHTIEWVKNRLHRARARLRTYLEP